MRKLIWFTLGFGTACGVCAYLGVPKFLILPVLAAAVGCLLLFRQKPAVLRFWLLLLGICAGISWFVQFRERKLEPVYRLDGVTQTADIRCNTYPEETDYGSRVRGYITIDSKAYPVMVYLDENTGTEPGTLLSGSFLFRVTAPGGQKESYYYQGEGIFLLAYPAGKLTATESERSWRDIPAILGQNITGLLAAFLPEDAYVFAKALMLGDSSDLDYGTLTDLSVSGIRHIVAVSGLHVSILFGFLGAVTFRRRYLTALVGFPLLLFFVAMTGFTPSVCRACMMSGLMLLASVVNREYDGPSALAFAGLVLMAVNPMVITSVSYQLSFASVAGIFACAPGIRKWLLSVWKIPKEHRYLAKLINGLILTVSVTLGATVSTMPLCAVYFGTVSLASLLTNLLTLWAVSVIFYGLLLMCILGCFWSGGAAVLGRAVTVLIRYVLKTAEVIGDFPLSAVYTKSFYIAALLIFVYVLLAVFLASQNRKPAEFVCCTVLGLCLALVLSWAELRADEVRFTVLDVGQGQCLLLQTEGRTYMVDCGGNSDSSAADAAAQTLLSQGISELDGVILTHYDRDHAGGLENLLTRVETQLLILPPVYSDKEPEAERILYAKEDLVLESGKTKIYIFASANTGSGNENSLCILFDTENCDILVTGDRSGAGERMLLERPVLKDVDVLVAGHHGSKDSTCEELLAAVRPEVVCISAGEGNRYGHPAPELLQRLESWGCAVYRTDLHGDILIRR